MSGNAAVEIGHARDVATRVVGIGAGHAGEQPLGNAGNPAGTENPLEGIVDADVERVRHRGRRDGAGRILGVGERMMIHAARMGAADGEGARVVAPGRIRLAILIGNSDEQPRLGFGPDGHARVGIGTYPRIRVGDADQVLVGVVGVGGRLAGGIGQGRQEPLRVVPKQQGPTEVVRHTGQTACRVVREAHRAAVAQRLAADLAIGIEDIDGKKLGPTSRC